MLWMLSDFQALETEGFLFIGTGFAGTTIVQIHPLNSPNARNFSLEISAFG